MPPAPLQLRPVDFHFRSASPKPNKVRLTAETAQAAGWTVWSDRGLLWKIIFVTYHIGFFYGFQIALHTMLSLHLLKDSPRHSFSVSSFPPLRHSGPFFVPIKATCAGHVNSAELDGWCVQGEAMTIFNWPENWRQSRFKAKIWKFKIPPLGWSPKTLTLWHTVSYPRDGIENLLVRSHSHTSQHRQSQGIQFRSPTVSTATFQPLERYDMMSLGCRWLGHCDR